MEDGSSNPPDSATGGLGATGVAIAVAAAGPGLRTLVTVGALRGAAVLGLIAVAVVVTGRTERHRHAERAVVAAAVALAVAPLGGGWVGVWALASTLLGLWVGRELPPWPTRRPLPGVARQGAVLLSVIALARGRDGDTATFAVSLTVVALALSHLASRHAERVRAVGARVGGAVSKVVTAVVFTVLGVAVVAIPWFADRLLRVDPLATWSAGPSRWVQLERPSVRPARLWSRPRAAIGPGRGARVRRRVSSAVSFATTAALLAGCAAVALALRPDPGTAPNQRPAAFIDAEWWEQYVEEMQWAFFTTGTADSPLRYPGMNDVRSRYINIEDGERRSWRPPLCASCPDATVWIYGGSTVVGLGQRDDHTIASEIARAAADDGWSLTVRNRGVLGDLHWEEAQRFAWDVVAEAPPDAVVFLDGYNEVAGTDFRDSLGHGLDGTPVDWTAENTMADLLRILGPFQSMSRWFDADPPGASVVTRPEVPRAPASEIGTYAQRMYRLGRTVGVDAAERAGVDALWYWQPTRFSRPQIPNEPRNEESRERHLRAAFDAAGRDLPDGVTDLTDLFDVDDGPLFFDDSHSNEESARRIAARIWADLRSRVPA